MSRAGLSGVVNRLLTRASDPPVVARLVLLLGNDSLTQLVVGRGLHTYGYEGATASTPAVAQEILQSRRVGVLVTDLDSDTASRLAFVRSARRADPSLAVIYTARVPSGFPTGRRCPAPRACARPITPTSWSA